MNGWEDIFSNALQNVQDWWSQLGRTYEEPEEGYEEEPGALSPEERVSWELARREAEAVPQEAPWWENLWGQAERGMRWYEEEVQGRPATWAAQLATGQPLTWDPNWEQYQRWAEPEGAEQFPGQYGLTRQLFDPLNWAMLLPAKAVTAARQIPVAGRVLGPMAEWLGPPWRWAALRPATRQMFDPTSMEEAISGIRGLGLSPAGPLELGAHTAQAEADQVHTILYDGLRRIASSDPERYAEVLEQLRAMGAQPGMEIPTAVREVLGEKLPLSKEFRIMENVLARMDPDTFATLHLAPDELGALRIAGEAQGPALDEALQIIGQTGTRLESRLRRFIGGSYETGTRAFTEGGVTRREALPRVWNPGLFRVPEMGRAQRWQANLKDWLSTVWLGWNPAYAFRNQYQNISSILSYGVVPWGNVDRLQATITRLVGFMPQRAAAGIVAERAEALARPGVLGRAPFLRKAQADEQNAAIRAFSNVFMQVRNELINKMDFTGLPPDMVPAVKALLRTVNPAGLPDAMARLLRVPGSVEIHKALSLVPEQVGLPTFLHEGLHPEADAARIARLAARGDIQGLIRHLEQSAAAMPSPQSVEEAVERLRQGAIAVSPGARPAIQGVADAYQRTVEVHNSLMREATKIFTERPEGITSATAVRAMRDRKNSLFDVFSREIKAVLNQAKEVVPPEMQTVLTQQTDILLETNTRASRFLDQQYDLVDSGIRRARRKFKKGPDRDQAIQAVFDNLDAQKSNYFDATYNPAITSATNRVQGAFRAGGLESTVGEAQAAFRAQEAFGVGGTARGVIRPPGPRGGGEVAAEMASDYGQWARETAERLRGLAQAPPGPTGPPTDFETIMGWARGSGRVQLTEINAVATKTGEYLRERALLNYTDRRQIDALLSLAFPYHFWYTRTARNLLELLVHRPQYLNWFFEARRAQEEMNQGLPQRLRHTIALPWFGGELRFDPLRALLPLSTFTEPFIPEERTRTPVEHAAGLVMGLGPQPYPYLTIPGALATGRPEKWIGRFLPQTRQIQAATALAGIGGPTGVNIERALGLPGGVEWDPYRAERWIREEVTAGRIPQREGERAIATHTGPVWQNALGASMRRQAYPELMGLTGFRPQLVAPEESKYYREMRPEYRRMRALAQAGTAGVPGRELREQFYGRYPTYGIWQTQGTPEQRQAQVRESEFWDLSRGSQEFHRQQRQNLWPWETAYRDSKVAERNSAEALRAQYGGLDLRPSLRWMSQPEMRQYVDDERLRKASDAFFDANATTEEGARFRADILKDNPGLRDYWKRNDTPQEALWRTQHERILGAWEKLRPMAERAAALAPGGSEAGRLWERYWGERARGVPARQLRPLAEAARAADRTTPRGRVWGEYFAARARAFAEIGDVPAEELIEAVLKAYPGRWTAEELRALYAGTIVPGMQTWQTIGQRERAAAAPPLPAGIPAGAAGRVPTRPVSPPFPGGRGVPFTPRPARPYPTEPPPSWQRFARARPGERRGGGGGGVARGGAGGVNWRQYYDLPRASVERQEWLEAHGLSTDASRLHWDRWSRFVIRVGQRLTNLVTEYFNSSDKDAFLKAHPELQAVYQSGFIVNRFRLATTLDEFLRQLEVLWQKATEYTSRISRKRLPRRFFGR